MTVETISWSISTKVWDRTRIEIATPGSAVRHASVARHVTDCATRPGKKRMILRYHFLDFALGNSYFPSTLKLWNELDTQDRTLPTISRFKSNIKTIPDKILYYTNVGERKDTTMMTRIRHRSSSLKADFYGVNIIQVLGVVVELLSKTQNTIVFECPLYTYQRNNLFNNLHRLQINDADVSILKAGSHNYDGNVKR